MDKRSLQERKQELLDEMMAAGGGGFTAAAPAEGPVAGFDPVMSKTDKVLRRRKKKKVAEAYYGGEEQRKEDEKKKKIDKFMDKAMPSRTFDQLGRETDRRTGKLKEDLFSEEELAELSEKLDGKTPKDKDYSLRDWFKGGGWKQTGGKYDGKPCAKQPGQTTKPFCRDADARASMDKDERDSRAAKKRREDPDADRSGKAKNVSEEKDACYSKVKSRYKIWPSAYASGALVKCRKKGASNWGNSDKKKKD